MKKDIISINHSIDDAVQKHFKFQGLSLDGDPVQFSINLMKKGFTYYMDDDEHILLEGRFANEDVILAINITPFTKIVYSVSIYISKPFWDQNKKTYMKFKGLLTKKYGEPTYCSEIFKDPDYAEGGLEAMEIFKGNANFVTGFDNDLGSITLAIIAPDCISTKVLISYEDKFNTKINEREQDMSELNDV